MTKLYAQYGCGLSAPKEWVNFDVSPTLRLQKVPLLGAFLKSRMSTAFPSNVRYGDIISGLPLADDSCDGLYCSHTLEHLSLNDFRQSLKNSYKILKKGGIFRCVVPDLEVAARQYVESLNQKNKQGSFDFLNETLLGVHERPRGVNGLARAFLGNANHLWMWDVQSLSEELRKAGFTQIRACTFNDCEDDMFRHVEESHRFERAVAIECRK